MDLLSAFWLHRYREMDDLVQMPGFYSLLLNTRYRSQTGRSNSTVFVYPEKDICILLLCVPIRVENGSN